MTSLVLGPSPRRDTHGFLERGTKDAEGSVEFGDPVIIDDDVILDGPDTPPAPGAGNESPSAP